MALQEDMLDKNISIERANFFPTLSLVGSYQYQTQDNTFAFRNYLWATSLNVGLQVSFPLFDGFRTGARTEQAMIDRDKIHYARLKAEEGLKIQLQAAELRMAEAKKRIAGQERNVGQAEKAVRIAQTRYKSGVGTQLELMDSEVAMTRARATRAQAIYDFLVAKAEWENASGHSLTH
jgi:outer membrane protein TolC